MSIVLVNSPSLHPNELALAVLIQAYCREAIPNRSQSIAHSQSSSQYQSKSHTENEKQSSAADRAHSHAQATPMKPNIFRSPINSPLSPIGMHANASPRHDVNTSSSSFFASPTTSSIAHDDNNDDVEDESTPKPKTFNLGLNFGGAPPMPNNNNNSDNLHPDPMSSNKAAALSPIVSSFSRRSYQRLGLLLQKAVLNGGIYDSTLYDSIPDPAVTNPHSSMIETFPSSTPRYPTLSELRTMVRNKLPAEENFNQAVELYLVEKLDLIQQPDDIFTIVAGKAQQPTNGGLSNPRYSSIA